MAKEKRVFLAGFLLFQDRILLNHIPSATFSVKSYFYFRI